MQKRHSTSILLTVIAKWHNVDWEFFKVRRNITFQGFSFYSVISKNKYNLKITFKGYLSEKQHKKMLMLMLMCIGYNIKKLNTTVLH